MKLEDLKQEVLKLSDRDRAELAQALILSLEPEMESDPEHQKLWLEEIERR